MKEFILLKIGGCGCCGVTNGQGNTLEAAFASAEARDKIVNAYVKLNQSVDKNKVSIHFDDEEGHLTATSCNYDYLHSLPDEFEGYVILKKEWPKS